MGCDVHPVIQVRDKEWDEDKSPRYAWRNVAIPDRDRCYAFFGALAGVRVTPPRGPVSEPKGFPKNADAQNHGYADIYSIGAFVSREHSASWLSLREMQTYDSEWLKTFYREPGGDYPWVMYQRWVKTMAFYAELYGLTSDEVRVVFDFDS